MRVLVADIVSDFIFLLFADLFFFSALLATGSRVAFYIVFHDCRQILILYEG